jgi:anti-anti-sigma factor
MDERDDVTEAGVQSGSAERSGSEPPDGSSCRVVVTDVDGEPVVVVEGEIDLAAVERLWQAIETVPADRRVVLDLARVTFIDSSGLIVVLRAHLSRGGERSAVVVRRPSPPVALVLEMTGIDAVVDIER